MCRPKEFKGPSYVQYKYNTFNIQIKYEYNTFNIQIKYKYNTFNTQIKWKYNAKSAMRRKHRNTNTTKNTAILNYQIQHRKYRNTAKTKYKILRYIIPKCVARRRNSK